MRGRLQKTMSSAGRGHTLSWNVARRSFKTHPAIPLIARDTSLVGKRNLLTLLPVIHIEANCGLSLQKMGDTRMRPSVFYCKSS